MADNSKKQQEPQNERESPNSSELERMTDLTRRIVNVPAKELAKEKRKDEKKHGH